MKFLTDLVEDVAGFALERERIRAGIGLGSGGNGNAGSDHPNVDTGVDHTGSTLVSGRLVSGVSNGALLAGAGALLGIGVLAIALVND